MTMHIEAQEPLKDAVVSSRLFTDWLAGQLRADFIAPEHRDAGVELLAALDGEALQNRADKTPVRLFQSPWVVGWAASHEDDLPRDSDRAQFRSQVGSLQSGQADIVVTGQQPGWLGGPLYTLYKVATVIALARSRTLAGKPTVPVFWSGDDDDDLKEALSPVAVGIGGAGLVRSPEVILPGHGGERPVILGRRHADQVTAAGARWLEEAVRGRPESADPLDIDLAAIWSHAANDGWTWSRLARQSLLRVFQGSGLMVISGDDPGLHAAAGPLYKRILDRSGELAQLVGQRGKDLVSHGWHAQISPRSLKRPLFQAAEDRRLPWEPGQSVPDVSQLRPGVMLRSPVQDWLLEPAAVVVGPGELAYLRQLDPIYRELAIGRPPLVPRLFAWLLPAESDPNLVARFRQSRTSDPLLAATLADQAEKEARQILENILKKNLEIAENRSVALAEGRARRWRKGVEAMLRDEIERSLKETESLGPEWVFPEGKRQERHLAYLCAASLWGEDLVESCLKAAQQHLAMGQRTGWREFVIEVPSPR